jgi:hypothetical protein
MVLIFSATRTATKQYSATFFAFFTTMAWFSFHAAVFAGK